MLVLKSADIDSAIDTFINLTRNQEVSLNTIETKLFTSLSTIKSLLFIMSGEQLIGEQFLMLLFEVRITNKFVLHGI